MGIVKWAAVAVTLLMGLANLGQIAQQESNLGLKIYGSILFVAAVVAVVGLVTRRSWGTRAVLAVGVVNLAGAVVGAIAGLEGWPIGLVLSGLAIVLAAVSAPGARRLVNA
jgi:hypothetical protein